MMVILSLEVNLAIGTQKQLLQHLVDQNHESEFFARTPDGETYLHYGIVVKTVVIESELFSTNETKELPPELEI